MMDTAALPITVRLERAIQHLSLEVPAEFAAIINAIDMQLESRWPVVAAVAQFADALRELTLAQRQCLVVCGSESRIVVKYRSRGRSPYSGAV
jgi:hypothetical protein